jgi:hypothetical protein
MQPFQHVAPLGTAEVHPVYGRATKKPWDYEFTAAIPHLNTIESLRACIELVRLQSVQPYLMVVDTGSPPEVCSQLERMRGDDLEVHYIRGHAYRHSSEPVTAALDLAQTLCRTPHLLHLHSDVFFRRRDFAESLMRVCNANTPVVGYRMSPRDWITREWEWMVGHTASMLYMPSIHRAGVTWSMQRMHHQFAQPWQVANGWPDTETGFNLALREAGIVPVFIGYDRNGERQIDDNIDHVRSYPGSKAYSAERYREAQRWMKHALVDAEDRAAEWRSLVGQEETH